MVVLGILVTKFAQSLVLAILFRIELKRHT
jgi:hypothetical protein